MDIVEELSLGISAWLAANPKRNKGVLQKRTGVSEPTLRRIHEREQKTVTLEVALELAHALFDTDEALTFIKKNFPVAGRWQEKLYSKKDDVVTWGELLKDEITMNIILRCDTVSGASTEEIKEVLGTEGLRQLSRLVELGFIEHINGMHKCTSEGTVFFASHHVHLAMLMNMIKFYDPENANIRSACRERVWYQGLNRSAVQLLSHKLADFEQTLAETLEDPNARGDIPWFFGMIQNVFRSNLL